MATTYTPNFNLGKQEDLLDKFDMSVITRNADIIDMAIADNATAIEANTTDIEQNKSDILSIRTDVNDIIPKLSTVSVTSDAENNWYRIFQANQKQTARSGIIMINRAYSNLPPESYTLFFNFAHSNNVFRLITKKVESHKIDKIRLVYKRTSQQDYPCYIDIHYNGTKINQINVSMHCESAALTGASSTFENLKFVSSDFSVAEIPDGYTSYEFDLAYGDIFDRLEALEAALTQITTLSE